jgi:hypothetical protein
MVGKDISLSYIIDLIKSKYQLEIKINCTNFEIYKSLKQYTKVQMKNFKFGD